MTQMTCPRCDGPCEREQRSQNVWHYTCPDPDCQPATEPAWRFVLGLLWEIVVLLPFGALNALYRRVRGS